MITSGQNYRSGKKRYTPMSEINVTPFVDVMLVLLIIFMVTAPLLTVGIPVDLPKVKSNALTDQKDPLEVTVRLEDDQLTSQAKGSDPEIIVASAKAYINALNKLIYKKTRSKNEQISALKIEGV